MQQDVSNFLATRGEGNKFFFHLNCPGSHCRERRRRARDGKNGRRRSSRMRCNGTSPPPSQAPPAPPVYMQLCTPHLAASQHKEPPQSRFRSPRPHAAASVVIEWPADVSLCVAQRFMAPRPWMAECGVGRRVEAWGEGVRYAAVTQKRTLANTVR